MKKTTVILSVIIGVSIVAGMIELLYPAPKMRDFCQQVPCPVAAQDVLVGKYQDYRGQLVPYFLGGLALGILFVVLSFFFRKLRWLLLVGFSIISATIIYAVLLRFVLPFSIWPIQTWTLFIVLSFASTARFVVGLFSRNAHQRTQ